ncbi:hypothetical protein [Grimontia hollisae]|uniref:hypothetical protein n=1 Tax=Grimontia hollisae TaxID=673 RepID=UPI0011C02ADE|nr:hypothetical protein [Grimontia hollisae]
MRKSVFTWLPFLPAPPASVSAFTFSVLKFVQRSVFGVGASAGAGSLWRRLIVVFDPLIVCFDHVKHKHCFNISRLFPLSCALLDR